MKTNECYFLEFFQFVSSFTDTPSRIHVHTRTHTHTQAHTGTHRHTHTRTHTQPHARVKERGGGSVSLGEIKTNSSFSFA